MRRFFSLTVALIPLIAEIAVSRPLAAQSSYPVVPSSDAEMLLCYMQTPDGRVLQLDRLCGKESEAPVTASVNNISNGNASSQATCYPEDAPECINSQFAAPPPPAYIPAETEASSVQQ